MMVVLVLLMLLFGCFLIMLLGVALGILVFDLIMGDDDAGPAPGTTWKWIKRGALF